MRQPDPSNSEFNFPKTTCRESFSPGGLSTSSQHARRGSSQLYSKLTHMYLGGVCVCVCVCGTVCLHVEPSASLSKATCRRPGTTAAADAALLTSSGLSIPLPERGWCWYLELGAGRSARSSPSLSLPWYGYSTVPRRSHDDDDEHHYHAHAHAHAHHHHHHHRHHHHHHHHHHYNHRHHHQQEPWLQLPAPPRPPTDEERVYVCTSIGGST